jgi:PAS domain S-box-containing protein
MAVISVRRRLGIIEQVPAVVWETSEPEGKVLFVNQYAEQLAGFPIRDWTTRPRFWLRLMHPADRNRVRYELRRALARAQGGTIEFRWIRRDGRVLWVTAHCRGIYEEHSRRLAGMRAVAVDITERKHAEDEMLRSQRAQRDFVANVSHDFRTPLAAIRGYTETLLRGGLTDSRNRLRFINAIMRNTSRLSDLVEDVLLVSTLDSRPNLGHPENFYLHDFVSFYVDEIAPLLRKAKQNLRLEIPRTLEVRADRAQLQKILQNLISNAISHNRKGAWIKLDAERGQGGKIVVSVKDCGDGIPGEHLPRIFDRFYKVDPGRNTASTGLGLHIVKQLVEASGNRVWANSRVGRGSTFYFTLDRARARASGPAAVDSGLAAA